MRHHGNLDQDDPELNEAAWVATRGAVTGAARVRCLLSYLDAMESHPAMSDTQYPLPLHHRHFENADDVIPDAACGGKLTWT